MSCVKIKICGLKRVCDIEYVNELMPDYIGFVFAKKNRRITKEQAVEFKRILSKDIKSVGVFLNEDENVVIDIYKSGSLDFIQLHGNEDNAYIERVRKQTGAKIIKAFKVQTKEDLDKVKKCNADMFMLDNGTGGTGESFNWDLLKDFDIPYFLAGGINKDNIDEALDINPFAIDLSSGVETDGFKDFDKMKYIVEKVRNNG